jgi:DNA polymerase-3 subunit alpha
MGKKDDKEMSRQKDLFLEGAKAGGIDPKKAEAIFDLMHKFAEYGFNKSHSAAYALIAYQTAYLKAHYPVEFLAALLSCDMDSTDKVIKNINDCREQGIEVFPPDINKSGLSFTVVGKSMRFGLGAVKNVGAGAIEAILEARKDGPFIGLYDFCERVDLRRVNKRVVESLIKCGAFDSTGATRASLIEGLESATSFGQRIQEENASLQVSLFGADEVVKINGGNNKLPDRTERLFNQRVDENGWFLVEDIAPATRYHLTITAEPEPGDPLESQPIPIDGSAGETVDIGTVTLQRSGDHK